MTPVAKHTGLDRVFDLPPFWLAFAFMALVSLPMSYVALPISSASLGILPSIAIIVVVTFVMCLSTTAIAEAVVACPADRRPKTLRDVVTYYLGEVAGNITAVAISIVFFVVLVACSISMVSTLSFYTGLSEEVWLAIVGLAVLVIISVGSIAHSLSLVAGAVALVLMMAILIALVPFVDMERLLFERLPFTDHRGLAPEVWSGFLGVIILSFIGPLLLVPAATYVLPRASRPQQYIAGSLWGIVFQGVLMVLWITFVELSTMPTTLIGLHGTVFLKLGEMTDGFIKTTGTVLIFVLPGLAAIRSAAQLGVQIRLFLSPKEQPHTKPAIPAIIIWKYLIPALPTLAAFALVGVLIEMNEADVSHFLSVGGILGSSIAAGVVPILMYRVVKSKGHLPAMPLLRVFRHPAALLGSSVFFSSVLLLYGLAVWDSLPVQILACGMALMNIVLTFRRNSP